jgi:uncharacterized metal-binding protein YceD (DUF177 family)
MTADPVPSWSSTVRLSELGKGLTRRLVADEATRKRIAAELDLEALGALEALVTVKPRYEGGDVTGELSAQVTQMCGVTLEPFDTDIRAEFTIPFTTREPEPPAPGEELGMEALDAPDVVSGDTIDLAAYVVEQLALELDPFPRKPDAVFVAPDEPEEASPFSVLSTLKPRENKD